MEAPADRPPGAAVPGMEPGPASVPRSPLRRRPSGQPPPLPHHLQTTGVGWLVAAVVLSVLSVLVFAGGLRGPAVAVTAVEDALVQWAARDGAP